MRVANTVDLKNKTNELVRWAMAGEPVIITLRGKPAAALTPLSERDLESFVLRYARQNATRRGGGEEMIRYTHGGRDRGPIYGAHRAQGGRAVGNACAKNPVPLLVPCHRVVRSDGGVGGYSLRGGAALKRRLLEQEGVDISEARAS